MNLLSIVESVLIVAALFFNIFLIGQYEGSMVCHLEWKTIAAICLIVGVFETFSMWIGYLLTRIPFFSESTSEDLRRFCYFVAAIMFLLIAVYMIYKAVRRTPIQERLREIAFKRITGEVILVALFTFMAGIGWGFIGHNIYMATTVVSCATIIAAICGIYVGYSQGCRMRYAIYGAGGAMLAFVGVDILIRYL